MVFFKKSLFSTPVYLPGGRKVLFTEVGDDTGVLATEDGFVISELTKLVNAGNKGGVVITNEAEYKELKKNPPTKRPSFNNSGSAPDLRQKIRALQARLAREEGAAAGNAGSPQVQKRQMETPRIDVPKDIPRPVTRKLSELVPPTSK